MADRLYYDDVVLLNGRRGLVDRQHPYDPEKRLLFFEGGGSKWVVAADVEKLPAEFLGLPNDDHAPEPGQPLTLWEQIPHGFSSYLWWDTWDWCMYCGLSEAADIHVEEESSE
ncbi:hypothetical protein ACFU99_05840 [Streptomyces sp. NPDC057654]|uniref:hypothetical protein n=1 Tax=Streptomyces sp. NPDC057654 TaxID=3346196 RepID=UPI0036A08566